MARRPRGSSMAQTIGGVLVGFDEQVLGRRPPGQEVVEQIDRSVTSVPGTGLVVEVPAPIDPPGRTPAPGRTRPAGPGAATGAADARPGEGRS